VAYDPGASPTGPSPAQVAVAAAARQALAYRLLGAACALVGVLLVVGGLLALRGRPVTPASSTVVPGITTTPSAASPSASTPTPPSMPPSPTSTAPPLPSTTIPAPAPLPASPAPSAAPTSRPARAPLTVLNNTTHPHLAERVAGQLRSGGWRVVAVGNFTGTLPATTVYYTPGNTAEQRAALALAAQYPKISRVLPRFAGLPESVHGVVVVLAPDW